jgi:subtilisin family serine protease
MKKMNALRGVFHRRDRRVRRDDKEFLKPFSAFFASCALKKFFSLSSVLGVVIILILFPLAASAQGDAPVTQGDAPVTQGVEDTPTLTEEIPAATDTLAPSETPPAADTSTPIPTKTPKPSKTPRPTPSETPLPTLGPTLPEVEPLPGDYAPDEVIVEMASSASRSQRKSLQAFGDLSDSTLQDLGVTVLKVPEGSVSQTIAALEQQPGVLYAEPNYYVYAQDVIPNDLGWPLQWGLPAIRAPQGWELGRGSPNITIAILDSGVDLAHPDLVSKLVSGYDFVNHDADPQDDYGHGTQVAGIAAAATNNLIGIAGISWGAHIMPVKVLNSSGVGTYANVAAGIRWATDHGAQVINLSLGGPPPSDSKTLKGAVNYAVGKGVTLVASAGNAYGGAVLYPAAYNGVIAVAAVDQNLVNAAFTACGPQVDVAAPGVAIYTLQLGGGTVNEAGTSMSAPFVAGAAAILLGLPGNNAPSLVAHELKTTALDLGKAGWDSCTGYGLIQLDAAMRSALNRLPAADTPNPIPTAPPDAWGLIGGASPTPTPSLTLTPTLTERYAALTGTLPTYTPTLTERFAAPTVTLTIGLAAGKSSATPEPAEVSAQAATPGANPFLVPLPCLGGFFVLTGLAILLYAIRLRRNS